MNTNDTITLIKDFALASSTKTYQEAINKARAEGFDIKVIVTTTSKHADGPTLQAGTELVFTGVKLAGCIVCSHKGTLVLVHENHYNTDTEYNKARKGEARSNLAGLKAFI